MASLRFMVRGGSGDIYEVRAERAGGRVTMRCQCLAGQSGQSCRHRLALIEGDVSDLVSGNHDDVTRLSSWLPGSPLESALAGMAEAEAEVKAAQGRLSQAKKAVARSMYGCV